MALRLQGTTAGYAVFNHASYTYTQTDRLRTFSVNSFNLGTGSTGII